MLIRIDIKFKNAFSQSITQKPISDLYKITFVYNIRFFFFIQSYTYELSGFISFGVIKFYMYSNTQIFLRNLKLLEIYYYLDKLECIYKEIGVLAMCSSYARVHKYYNKRRRKKTNYHRPMFAIKINRRCLRPT